MKINSRAHKIKTKDGKIPEFLDTDAQLPTYPILFISELGPESLGLLENRLEENLVSCIKFKLGSYAHAHIGLN